MLNITNVSEWVRNASVEDLEKMEQMISLRKQFLSGQMMLTIRAGDKMRFVSKVRPRYLVGLTGVVKEVRGSKIVIDLDAPNGKWHKGIHCPASILEKV